MNQSWANLGKGKCKYENGCCPCLGQALKKNRENLIVPFPVNLHFILYLYRVLQKHTGRHISSLRREHYYPHGSRETLFRNVSQSVIYRINQTESQGWRAHLTLHGPSKVSQSVSRSESEWVDTFSTTFREGYHFLHSLPAPTCICIASCRQRWRSRRWLRAHILIGITHHLHTNLGS